MHEGAEAAAGSYALHGATLGPRNGPVKICAYGHCMTVVKMAHGR